MMDTTIVSVALPRIGEDLDADVSALQWVLTGYLLALASLILLSGALGDRFGRRRVFLVGTAWFAVASAACGLAPSIETLVAARLLQGVGAALLTPGSLAIIQASFVEDDRAPAVGAWSGLGGVAAAVGPLVGGWLVDGPGWRWAFFVNLPFAAAAILCARVAVPETRDEHPPARLDVLGAGLAVLGLGSATWALTEAGPRGWTAPTVLGGAAVAAIAGAAFVVHLRRASDPLLPPRLFRIRAFTVTNLATAALYAAIGVAFFLVAYELQVAAGWSALRAGAALLPATALMLLLSARSGALARRIGPRAQLTVGPVVTALGLLALAQIGSDADWLRDVVPGATLFGIGLVTFVAPLTATVMGAVDPDHVSTASGINNAIARTASLAALAVVPVVSGLDDAVGTAEVTSAYHTALVIAAGLALAAAPIGYLGLRDPTRSGRSARASYCAVDGPPLQPDPRRCPLAVAPGTRAEAE